MSDCILAKGKPSKKGYARCRRNGVDRYVHVWAWIDSHAGEIPAKGMEVCHSCDVRNCINPDHLFLGTHQENVEDMMRKGRSAKGSKSGRIKHPEAYPTGNNIT